jgi:hypothetical protein
MIEFTKTQQDCLRQMTKRYETEVEAHRLALSVAGQMQWRTNRAGLEYLYRTHSKFQAAANLGPRSPSTEAIAKEFAELQSSALRNHEEATANVQQQAAQVKDLELGFVSAPIARVLRVMDLHAQLDEALVMLGTPCLYAYCYQAHVDVARSMLDEAVPIEIVDNWLLFGSKHIADRHFLFKLLVQTDRTFAVVTANPLRIASNGGMTVMFTNQSKPEALDEEDEEDEAEPAPAPHREPTVDWLIDQPRVRVLVPGVDGVGVPFCIPDIRAFFVHKAWRAERQSRPPELRRADAAQAAFALALLQKRFPELEMPGDYVSFLPVSYQLRWLQKGNSKLH